MVSGEVNASVAGTYTLTYNVSDAAGNAAQSVSRTVEVDFGAKESQLVYKLSSSGSSDYVFTGQGLDGAKDPE